MRKQYIIEFSYFTDLQGSQTSAYLRTFHTSLVTLLIYKVLKRESPTSDHTSSLVTLLIYKVLKPLARYSSRLLRLVTLLIYKVLKLGDLFLITVSQFSYFTDLQGSQTPPCIFIIKICLVTLLIYKVLKLSQHSPFLS